MMTPRLMWGLLVLSVVAASPPRYARQIEVENYDDNNVDVDLNVDGDYDDYYDVIEKPEVEIGTVDPDEGIDPSHSASLEEQEEEDVFVKPPLIQSGSEQSGTVMGTNAQGEEERRLMPIDNLQITGNTSGDLGSGSAVASGDLPDDKASGSGEPLGSGSYEASGDISVSVDSGDLGSGVSGLSGSGIILISGGEEELHPMLEIIPLEASGDFEESVISGGLEVSGLAGVSGESGSSGVLEVSGESGASGVPEVSGESGASGIPEVSGQFEESGIPEVSGEFVIPEHSGEPAVADISGESGLSGVSDLSGESGISGVPDLSGESEISGVPDLSGESEISGVPGLSGESEISGVPDLSGESEIFGGPEVSGEDEIFGESGEPEISGVPDVSGEHVISEVPETSGVPERPEIIVVPEVTERPEIIGVTEVFTKPGPFDMFEESGVPEESGESGVTDAPDIITTMLIPDLDEEEEIFLTTPTTPQEGAGGDIGSGIPDIESDFDKDTKGMATCMLCTCLVGSVYCDDLKLHHVPPLSKDTTHFYARYNRINRISKSSFANMNKLKRIDLTNNGITRIDDDAFFGLPALEELILRENVIRQLPALPSSMTLIDACHNQLGSTGIQREAFKDMPGLLYLYLTDNNIDHIPVPLPDSLRSLHLQNNNIQMLHEDTFCNPHDLNYIRKALEDVRLDGNPINLSRTPQAYICLPRIPIGTLI